MLRIGLFGSSSQLGGTEIYMKTLIYLMKDKIIFDYIIPHDCEAIPFESYVQSLGGKVYREYFTHSERRLKNYISPHELITKHPEWDGIYLNVQDINTSYRVLVAAKKNNLKYRILHIHNNDRCNETLKDMIYRQYFKISKNYVISHYFACSKNAGIWAYGKKINFLVIPNGIDIGHFKESNKHNLMLRKKYNINKRQIVIGFCGRLSEQKDPLYLLDIFSELVKKIDAILLIIGDGPLKKEMKEKINKEGLTKRVIFIGEVKDSAEYYSMMDCFVLPSKFEGFGIVLLEAQAAGLRCYTSKGVVPQETNVTGRVNFISKNKNPDEWAARIIENGFDKKDNYLILENSPYSLKSMKRALDKVFFNDKVEN